MLTRAIFFIYSTLHLTPARFGRASKEKVTSKRFQYMYIQEKSNIIRILCIYIQHISSDKKEQFMPHISLHEGWGSTAQNQRFSGHHRIISVRTLNQV